MGPFDFLNNMKRSLEGYFQPGNGAPTSTLNQYFPSQSNNLRMDKGPAAPQLNIPPAQRQEPVPPPLAIQSMPVSQSMQSYTNSAQPMQTGNLTDFMTLLQILFPRV